MSAARVLVVNADDLGRTEAVNRGIAHAVEHGIVTSASLMVRWPSSVDAAAWAAEHPTVSIGLHLDLGEWECVAGEWRAVYAVVDDADSSAVHDEVRRQLDRFTELVGHEPTHLDSHQHVHRRGPAHDALVAAGRRLGVPVRGVAGGVAQLGAFYGQTGDGAPLPGNVAPAALARLVRSVGRGITELSCHPGFGADGVSSYDAERRLELEALCSPEVREVIAALGIRLAPFHLAAFRLTPG